MEILRDRWGINHIYAQNEADLFFVQGYAAAGHRDGGGDSRAARGAPRPGARLHLFRGDLDDELNRYHPRGKLIVEAYVRGVNAYIGETETNAALLPIEFRMLGIRPGRWTPAVVISRHQSLTANVGDEARLMRAIRAVGVDQVRDLQYFQGGDPRFSLDPAIDPKTFPDDVLSLYSAFRASVQFRPEDISPEFRGAAPPVAVRASGAPDPAGPEGLDADPRDIGSNNWVVSGSRTFSTFPILANDPHRVIAAPSLRYWVHLVAPGWNVIGGGEPVLPGVSIGHNEHGAWEAMRVITDRIPVKGGTPTSVELKYTRHDPVIFEDRANRKAYALRAAWLEPGGAPYLASLRMNQARTWDEFREACSFNHMPSENMVWVDRQGNIGWQAAGIQPLRRNWSGVLPVPGDGRYEWDGFLPIGALPQEANPSRGFIATANNYLMTPGYPWQDKLHMQWSDAFRASRITEVLGSGRLFSVAEMTRLQNDDLSVVARALTPLLRHVPLTNAASTRARDLLNDWDFVLDKDSVRAGWPLWRQSRDRP